MVKSTVSQWDTTAGNNADVGGVDIAENCAAAGVNNAMREMMAQLATALGAWSGTAGIDLDDSIKLLLGTGDDAEIYHDGANFYIVVNTGDTEIQTADFRVKSLSGETLFSAFTDGGFLAYHNNAITTQTTADGLTITGTVATSRTWQDVSGSRAVATTYQNTTGGEIIVSARVDHTSNVILKVSTDNFAANSVEVGRWANNSNLFQTMIVPDQNYYQITAGTINDWVEFRP